MDIEFRLNFLVGLIGQSETILLFIVTINTQWISHMIGLYTLTKHIDINLFFVKEGVMNKQLVSLHISGQISEFRDNINGIALTLV